MFFIHVHFLFESVENYNFLILIRNTLDNGKVLLRTLSAGDASKSFQPKGMTWEERAKTTQLRAVIDPSDYSERKNKFIDYLHKSILNKYLTFSGTEIVLDFGCGTGRFTEWLANRVSCVVGIDLTREMLVKAKSHCIFGNVDFLLCDGSNIPFQDESFDLILSVWVLQHFPNEALEKTAKQLVNIVRENGKICLIEQVSDRHSDYYIPRLPDAYINSFDNCGSVILRPIRRSKSTMQRLAKVMPKFLSSFLAKIEIRLSKKAEIPKDGYLDHLFIFRRSDGAS